MWLQVINKVKVTHQGEGDIKVKVKYLLSFHFYVTVVAFHYLPKVLMLLY